MLYILSYKDSRTQVLRAQLGAAAGTAVGSAVDVALEVGGDVVGKGAVSIGWKEVVHIFKIYTYNNQIFVTNKSPTTSIELVFVDKQLKTNFTTGLKILL